ncbi:alpha/beta hydrolase [Dyella sp.]|jgi:pimeloyl-ACP methyl ester carboxylesterase|uniref:alpha/beta fold hydrolase n=1 Tax=Dyella sp. TaxID=1869338 RepID=UPI002FD93297
MQKPRAARRRIWRRLGQIVLGATALLILLGTAGGLWNLSVVHRLRKANPPPGRLYAVDGRRMHLYCTGEGSPIIVLEAGFGEDFTVWGKVQPALSSVTKVCSYDRAGFGWSETQPGIRDANHVADELHGLLKEAGITEPLVLVGHSFGGIYIRDYASRFPHAVAGLVFVDATSPAPAPMPVSMASLDKHSAFEFAIVRLLVDLGIARMTGSCDAVPPGFDTYAGWIKANTCVPAQVEAYRAAYEAQGISLVEASHADSFGDMRILVFSQDTQQSRPSILAGRVSAADWQAGMAAHDSEQEALKKLSANSYRIIAKGSGHYIHFDRPELLIREVGTFVQRIREGTVDPQNGTTKLE